MKLLSPMGSSGSKARVATTTPEARGLARDEVRLLVSTPEGHEHARFTDLPSFLRPGTVLVVNRSATLPSSLPASGRLGSFLIHLSTRYGPRLWLAEPRWSASQPGPLPLRAGEMIEVAGVRARLVAPYPGIPRLWFIDSEDRLEEPMTRVGRPIRYGYLEPPYPELEAYQTIFATSAGSAEMPSAARPFTPRVIAALEARGAQVVTITLHAGVSSLEVEEGMTHDQILYPEPFEVRAAAARAVNTARAARRPVIAVGTTVARALESAWDGQRLRAVAGFTRLYLNSGRPLRTVDGMLTGLHDPAGSHLALLEALAGVERVRSAYAEAVQEEYLWHEFGDSHLLLAKEANFEF